MFGSIRENENHDIPKSILLKRQVRQPLSQPYFHMLRRNLLMAVLRDNSP